MAVAGGGKGGSRRRLLRRSTAQDRIARSRGGGANLGMTGQRKPKNTNKQTVRTRVVVSLLLPLLFFHCFVKLGAAEALFPSHALLFFPCVLSAALLIHTVVGRPAHSKHTQTHTLSSFSCLQSINQSINQRPAPLAVRFTAASSPRTAARWWPTARARRGGGGGRGEGRQGRRGCTPSRTSSWRGGSCSTSGPQWSGSWSRGPPVCVGGGWEGGRRREGGGQALGPHSVRTRAYDRCHPSSPPPFST